MSNAALNMSAAPVPAMGSAAASQTVVQAVVSIRDPAQYDIPLSTSVTTHEL